MQDVNQNVLSLDAIGSSRLKICNERSDAVGDVIAHTEEKQPIVYRRTRWNRVKWTDKMVKLLITAVSYIGEDVWSNDMFPKIGTWSAISDVMSERGQRVSPQQCEDMYNDLNKNFKRLNDILGRGTACYVVEIPSLMETMDLTHDVQEEVKKLLSSKQLFYREMCSYNNQNRLFLPDDPELQKSVLFALKRNGKYEPEFVVQDIPTKRNIVGEKRVSHMDCASQNFNSSSGSNLPNPNSSGIRDSGDNGKAEALQNVQHIMHQILQLQEQKLQIQAQILELKKQRLKFRHE